MEDDWQSPIVSKPPQGVKILWFLNGDVFVAQRFGEKYLCLHPGQGNLLGPPLLWKKCPVPEPYEGITRVRIEGCQDLITIDEMQEIFPKEYKYFIKGISSRKF